jgi:hypothetical protein
MYLDIEQHVEVELAKIEAALQHAKRADVLIAMDSNCRSVSWDDSTTKASGSFSKEFLISKRLHITNEDNFNTTFRNCRVARNVDLTLTNAQLLRTVAEFKLANRKTALTTASLNTPQAKIPVEENIHLPRYAVHSEKRGIYVFPKKA